MTTVIILLSIFVPVLISVILLPKTLHLLAEFVGHRLRRASRTRRELLLNRVATETKAFEAEHKADIQEDDDWENVLPSLTGSATNGGKANVDWNGIVGFFHPFW